MHEIRLGKNEADFLRLILGDGDGATPQKQAVALNLRLFHSVFIDRVARQVNFIVPEYAGAALV